MKKTWLVLCLMVSSFVLASCSADGEPFEEKSYTPDAQIKSIILDVRDREVEVTASEDERIHIRFFQNSKEYYRFSVSQENVLFMESVIDKAWTDYIGGKAATGKRKICLQIPSGLLDSLALSTTNEDISLSPLAVTGDITLLSNGGNINFEGLRVGSALSLTVKNGNISGTVIGSYDDFAIRCDVKKGKSNLPLQKDGGNKTLTVSGNNGDVQVELVKE